MTPVRDYSPGAVALCALATLAVAMGIGRFAFTPILPMMQVDRGLSVAQGGWLASANYVGYLLGSLYALRARVGPGVAMRTGLALIGVCTLGMGFVHGFAAWLLLRFIPGFASACVLVFVSAWALQKLASARRGELSGVVYAGVGAGIVVAGLACLALLRLDATSDTAWIVLGLVALATMAGVWRVLGADASADAATASETPSSDRIPGFWRLVLCYGAFGLGYIIPATFLPAMARAAIPDPAWFGLAWPVFGAASMLSTFVAARAGSSSQRRLWIVANVVMALGVLIPVALPDLRGIVASALCVGATFMVITMTGILEARRVAGARSRELIAAMTSAFAVGQIVGPLLVSGLVHLANGFSYALVASAVPLLVAAYVLRVSPVSTTSDAVASSR